MQAVQSLSKEIPTMFMKIIAAPNRRRIQNYHPIGVKAARFSQSAASNSTAGPTEDDTPDMEQIPGYWYTRELDAHISESE